MFEVKGNRNYSAVVVELKAFEPIKGADRIQVALVHGNRVIVSSEAKAGDLGIYFPPECSINAQFLGANNLFRKAEYGNADPAKAGFFEQNGRVRVLKMRGVNSAGFFCPLSHLDYLGVDLSPLTPGVEFDSYSDVNICSKYVPFSHIKGMTKKNRQSKRASARDRILPNQFRFHFDTANLRRNVHRIYPSDVISVTKKLHGTSVVISRVLVGRELLWYERVLKYLGVPVVLSEFGLVWSSRKVIKGVDGVEREEAQHYYKTDVWGEVAKRHGDSVPKGYTIYGEIIGYSGPDSMIQKGYHYGQAAGTNRLVVYRVTSTNPDGEVLELSWPQLKAFCERYNFDHVPEVFYGKASEFVPCVPGEGVEYWQERFLKYAEENFAPEVMCPLNNWEVPAEGSVIRIDKLDTCESYKIKSWRFLNLEKENNDNDVVDLETAESEEEIVNG